MCRPLARLASAIGALARGRNSFEPCNQWIPCPSHLSNAALACDEMLFNFIRLLGTSFQGTGEHLKMLFSLHLAFLEGLHWPYEFVQMIKLLYRNNWKMILKCAIFGGTWGNGKNHWKVATSGISSISWKHKPLVGYRVKKNWMHKYVWDWEMLKSPPTRTSGGRSLGVWCTLVYVGSSRQAEAI